MTTYILILLTIANPRSEPFIRGDADSGGEITIADAQCILEYVFLDSTKQLPCPEAADVNDDGVIDATDAIRLLEWMYLGGPPLPDPFPECDLEDVTWKNFPCFLGCETI